MTGDGDPSDNTAKNTIDGNQHTVWVSQLATAGQTLQVREQREVIAI